MGIRGRNLAELSKWNDLFITLDDNNSGSISASEFRKAMESSVPVEKIELLIDHLGIKDGSEISYEAFIGEMMQTKGGPDEDALLQEIFDEVDTERDGYLSIAEVQKIVA